MPTDIEGFMMVDQYYPYEHPRPENVVQLDVTTTGVVSVENILRAAYHMDLESLICVGVKNGKLYVMNTDPDIGDIIFTLQRAIHNFQTQLDAREVLTFPDSDEEPDDDGSAA